MKRHTFAMKIKPGKIGDFRRGLGEIWNKLTNFLDERSICNFSIWSVDNIVFGYYETKDEFEFTELDRDIVARWEEKYNCYYTWLSIPFETMKMMYQDFGIVRDSKELIRQHVFVAKIKPGMKEEYKLRHDALLFSRGDKITQGPDSNFSIWYAGGYVFGYDEIDTTMEHEKTQEELNNTIRWETGMLEVMDWLTNDVDWITGAYHPSIHRLCWH